MSYDLNGNMNGQLIINNWAAHTNTQDTGTITLQGGTEYSIRVEYREVSGNALLQLLWKMPESAGSGVGSGDLPGFETIDRGSLLPPLAPSSEAPPASIGTDTIVYLHSDHLGSVGAVTDASHAIISTQQYDPWGKVRTPNSTPTPGPAPITQTKIGYTGQKLDDTGLMYYHARMYDPGVGRFVSPDSVGLFLHTPQLLSRYTYVANNPMNKVDPTGHWLDPPGSHPKASFGQPPQPSPETQRELAKDPNLNQELISNSEAMGKAVNHNLLDENVDDAHSELKGLPRSGDVGRTSHVQNVNESLKLFDKYMARLKSLMDSKLSPSVKEYIMGLLPESIHGRNVEVGPACQSSIYCHQHGRSN